MKLHPNARLTPAGRWHVVQRVIEQGMSVRQAAEATGVSVRTVYKWLSRYGAEGRSGLADRSSRPHRSPRRTAPRWVQRIEQLRRRRKTAWEIAEQLALAPSTVSRILQQRGLGRLWRIAEAEAPPLSFHLDSNYPNPFNPSTIIAFALAQDADAVLTVYNVLGQKVATLMDRRLGAGSYQITFDAGGLTTGVYYYQLEAGGRTRARTMILLR